MNVRKQLEYEYIAQHFDFDVHELKQCLDGYNEVKRKLYDVKQELMEYHEKKLYPRYIYTDDKFDIVDLLPYYKSLNIREYSLDDIEKCCTNIPKDKFIDIELMAIAKNIGYDAICYELIQPINTQEFRIGMLCQGIAMYDIKVKNATYANIEYLWDPSNTHIKQLYLNSFSNISYKQNIIIHLVKDIESGDFILPDVTKNNPLLSNCIVMILHTDGNILSYKRVSEQSFYANKTGKYSMTCRFPSIGKVLINVPCPLLCDDSDIVKVEKKYPPIKHLNTNIDIDENESCDNESYRCIIS
jgi:hypothetical protein